MNTQSAREALAHLERLGGPGLVRDVVEVFRDQAPARVAEARRAWHAGSAPDVARAVHGLKSSAGQLGAASLAALCERAEHLAERGDLPEAGRVLGGVESELERFLLELPRPGAEPGGEPARRRVGVVEDNDDTRLILRRLLEPFYEVDECLSGPDALDRFVRRRPDAVVLDISLPGLDGLEVLSRLRELPALARIPVIALTAHAMVGDRERFLARGFDGYASKPILDEHELLDQLSGLLGRGA
jgi:CheY-like chemotaxis protein